MDKDNNLKTKEKSVVKEKTIGDEIMRTDFAKNDEVQYLKEEFAKLYTALTNRVINAQRDMENTPNIISDESVRKHMETIRKSEELMRCMSEACRLLENACMWAVKGLSA